VNLGLRIVGRRPDGYHELESLFVPLDLADEAPRRVPPPAPAGVVLSLLEPAPGVPAGAANLAVRAAEAFSAAAGLHAGVEIRLGKRTPAAAGLGGGSSDAAAVLRLLARHRPAALSPDDLRRLALELGADVPFFLDPRPAWVGGVGEHLEPATGIPPLALLLANPGAQVPTAAAYRAFDALHPQGRGAIPTPRRPDWSQWHDAGGALARWLHNDLESAALRLCPAIGRLRRRLEALGPLAVGMSGSGATLFGIFPDLAAARHALAHTGLEAPAWARVATSVGSGWR
jgi:4-diphosphocytidyl-2-C-methyl-D-erythritol kinase